MTNYIDNEAYQTDFRYLVRQTKQIALCRQPTSKLYHFLFCMSSPKRFFTIPSLSLAWSPSINENSETSKNSSYKNIDYQSQSHLHMCPLRLSNITFISWTYIPFQDDFDSFLFALDGWDMLLAAAVLFHGPLGIVFLYNICNSARKRQNLDIVTMKSYFSIIPWSFSAIKESGFFGNFIFVVL